MDRALTVDWQSNENHLLLNPRLPAADRARVERAWLKWTIGLGGHIGLLTSGSTSAGGRLIFLSKAALLASAAAVNEHLNVTAQDVWLKTLPDFHVGGLSILARASLNQARVENQMGDIGSWNAKTFAELAEQLKATLVSLVPSQVFDLVAQSLIAPSSLRAIVVGGGALTADLYAAARNLGWPVLPSYGLTECGSQVATASPIEQNKKSGSGFDLPPVFLLPHVRVESDGILPLKIQSPSLLTGLVNLDEGDGIFVDPKIDGWFETEDFATVQLVAGRPALLLQGRGPDFVKIGGESVSLSQLEAKLESVRIEINYSWDVALVAVDDSRLGSVIRLLAAPAPAAARQQLLDAYAARVLPYERIRKVVEVEQIPRSSLRKLLRLEAKRLAGTSS